MPKLKALRGAIGSYGRVASKGIVDVDENKARKLLKTKRFILASEADIAAAKKAQKATLVVETAGAAPGFSPMPEKPTVPNRLDELIKAGALTRNEARKLVDLQIDLSSDEIRSFLAGEMAAAGVELRSAQDALAAREQELAERESAVAKHAEEQDQREHDLAERETAIEAAEAKANVDAKAKADAEAKAAKASK